MKKLVMIVVAVLSCLNFAYSYDFEYGGLYYTILSKEDKTVSVTHGEHNPTGDIVIPQEVSSEGIIYTVTGIEDEAFRDCRRLTSVIFPASVTEIGGSAFSLCSGLTAVTIPSSVTKIGTWAFEGCSGLTNVNISDLTAWCNIKFVDALANPLQYAEHLYLNNEEIQDLVIPEDVTKIGDCAFRGYKGLTSVTIPTSVTKIGEDAFGCCSNLTSVAIPASVTEIGGYAFSLCSGLTAVTIPSSVTKIGLFAFKSCTGLTKVNISDLSAWCNIDFGFLYSNPLQYAEHLYLNNKEIEDLVIPEDVTEIGDYAFLYCRGLTSVTIPTSVTKIGNSAFEDCSGLTKVNISDLSAWCNVDFGNAYANPLNYAEHLYLNDEEIKDIVIPKSLTEICKYAFYGCTGLTSVSCLWDEPIIADENIFSDDTYYCPLYVPIGTLEKYDNTVPWYRFSNKIERNFTGVDSPIVDAETTYSISGNTLYIVGDAPVRVVAINGSVVYSGRGNCDVDLNKGLYVVVIGGKASKVAVR